jgi:hypothetical protein
MQTNVSVKILQEQGNDKATLCHAVSVSQELMLITRVNINTTSVCHYHGSVQTVGADGQANEATDGSQV